MISVSVLNKVKSQVRKHSFLAWLFHRYQDLKNSNPGVLKDLEATKKESEFIRTSVYPKPSRRVLIGSYSDFIYQIKNEAIFSSELKRHGYEPIIFEDHLCSWAPKYFAAYGIDQFAYPEDYELNAETRRTCEQECEKLLKGAFAFSVVKAWLYKGVKIGPQVLSGISRRNHLGAPDLSDPAIRSELESQLLTTLIRVHQVEALLENIRPEMLILNEANGPLFGTLTDLAIQRGLNVLMYVQPSRDDGIIWKRLNSDTRRLHPNSVSLSVIEKLAAELWTEKHETALQEELHLRYSGVWALQGRNQSENAKKTDSSEIRSQLGLRADLPVVCIFSHILWEANLFYGDDLFEDYGDWFVQTVQTACKNTQVQWLLKLHPANTWKRSRDSVEGELAEITLIKNKIGELPNHVKLLLPDAPMSTLSLFETIDAGITVRGTVGIELPCFGKPVYTAGTGRYSGLGFTRDYESKAGYLHALESLSVCQPLSQDETRRAKVHGYLLFRKRPWLMKSFISEFKWQKNGKDPLDHNLKLAVGSWQEADQKGDLKEWAQWAIHSDQVDFIGSQT